LATIFCGSVFILKESFAAEVSFAVKRTTSFQVL